MRRRIALVLVLALAVLLGGAPAVSACTTDDWLRLDAGQPGPGQQLTVEGGGFEAGAVELRWNGMEGAPLGTARAGQDGRFAATVEVPASAVAGRYSVVAVQDTGTGLRGWAYSDLVVPTPPPPPGGPSAAVLTLAGATLLLLAVLVGVRRRRHRTRTADLDSDLERLLQDDEVPTAGR